MDAKLHLAALITLLSMSPLADAQNCRAGSLSVQVTGHATTINISPTKQVGQICLTISAADGREIFDDCGALIGKLSALDKTSGTGTLSHTALFDTADFFSTVDDTMQATGVLKTDADGAPCALSVSEHMSRLKFGTGIFARASIDVYADGTISFCPDKNLNMFQLSGQGCVRERHRHHW